MVLSMVRLVVLSMTFDVGPSFLFLFSFSLHGYSPAFVLTVIYKSWIFFFFFGETKKNAQHHLKVRDLARTLA